MKTDEQVARLEKASKLIIRALSDNYACIGVDVVTYDRPYVFLMCTEDVDDPPARLH